jgi:hypothetical protein
MSWTNDDGLVIRFGEELAQHRNLGAYAGDGPVQWLEMLFKFGDDGFPLDADAASNVVNEYIAIPTGALIEEVEIVKPTTAFTGVNALLDVGVVDQLGVGTADPDGLIVAATLTELNAGGKNVAGWVGAYVGAVTTFPCLITVRVDADDYDAGECTIRIKYSIPPKNEDTLAWAK